MEYEIYIIKCQETGLIYSGCTASKNINYNPLKFFLEKNKQDSTKYKKLCKSIIDNGIESHIVQRTGVKGTKEECELKIYDKFKNVENLSELVSPERYDCDNCGMRIKKIYQDVHNEKYCMGVGENKITDSDLEF